MALLRTVRTQDWPNFRAALKPSQLIPYPPTIYFRGQTPSRNQCPNKTLAPVVGLSMPIHCSMTTHCQRIATTLRQSLEHANDSQSKNDQGVLNVYHSTGHVVLPDISTGAVLPSGESGMWRQDSRFQPKRSPPLFPLPEQVPLQTNAYPCYKTDRRTECFSENCVVDSAIAASWWCRDAVAKPVYRRYSCPCAVYLYGIRLTSEH